VLGVMKMGCATQALGARCLVTRMGCDTGPPCSVSSCDENGFQVLGVRRLLVMRMRL
jgi:hypothetical protein